MDSLTQIVLGAAVGEAVLGKKVGNRAMLWGAIAGTIPDLDVFSRFFVDPIRASEIHRGFSHSLVFSILAAPALAWLIAYIYRKSSKDWLSAVTVKDWTKLTFFSFVTHPLLDCHTAYGTQFLWPFEYRIAYQNIFVADPLYTLPFLFFVILAMTRKRGSKWRTKFNNWGLIISGAYMVLTLVLKSYVFDKFDSSLMSQNIEYQELDTRPMPLNSMLWMASVDVDTSILIGYYSVFDKTDDIPFTAYKKNHHYLGEMVDEQEVETIIKLSTGWYFVTKDEADNIRINDVRFGQFGMSKDPNSFVYSYKLGYDENGKFSAVQQQPEVDNMKEMFGSLWERIKGVE